MSLVLRGRNTTATGTPTSDCLNTPTICSKENRLFFFTQIAAHKGPVLAED